MTRMNPALVRCLLFLIMASWFVSVDHAYAEERPNIVVIIGDDWSWPHASILGDEVVKTPTFDRIANEGVLFENAFVSAPSCTPSRFSIATGQYHWRLGDGANLGGSIAADVPVYADLLREAGYKTGFARKGAAPSKHEFRGSDPFGKRFKNFDEFMDDRADNESFCFWYGAGEPHRPYDWQKSERAGLKLDEIKLPKFFPDNETIRTDIGDYYLRVQKLDRLAGQIVARLEDEGLLENTIVIMTSDNGMPFPRCKATLYDFGTRVPLAIRWGTKTKPGHRVSGLVSLIDLAPTILSAAGQTIPSEMTGRSLIKQLMTADSDISEPPRDHVLFGKERHVYRRPSRAIRTSDYLYIRNFSPASWPTGENRKLESHYDFSETPWPTKPLAFCYDIDPSPTKQWMRENRDDPKVSTLIKLAFDNPPDEELYDLKNDPDQLRNVVDEDGFADVRLRLSKQLTNELRDSGDPRFKNGSHALIPIHGWKIYLNDELWQQKPEQTKTMLTLMAVQLQRVVDVVPKKALQQLRTVPIWVNPTYQGVRPTAEYHPSMGWLVDNGRNGQMAKSIEVTNVSQFEFENTRMPYVMLHELSHAYHDQVLGFRNSKIRKVFEQAEASGGYDNVDRFTGRKIIKDKAYAMSNPKEYFAESTEAFFGKNDFFPFNREELEKHDPEMCNLLKELWGVDD